MKCFGCAFFAVPTVAITPVIPIVGHDANKDWSRKRNEAMMRGDWTEVSRLTKG